MHSILKNPNKNNLFLIYGNLDDMFFSPDLQKNNFRQLLNAYLRCIGYKQIVFYSGAKNMGKFVLDEESAGYAINANKKISNINYSSAKNEETPKRKNRINFNIDRVNVSSGTVSSVTGNFNRPAPETEKTELKYSQPKLTPADFLAEAKTLMADNKVKTAIIFPFLQDFVTDGSAPIQQYSELISYLWGEFDPNRNENICIFLAPEMDEKSVSDFFANIINGQVFRNRFFNEDNTPNKNCVIKIGLPEQDEFKYMLDYLRIVGINNKKITFKYNELKKIISQLMFISRELNKQANRSGYLNSIYNDIVKFIENSDKDIIEFTEETIKNLFIRIKINISDDPLEKLKSTRGWEAVYSRIDTIVKDYRRNEKKYLKNQSKQKTEASFNERIEPSSTENSFNYKIPSFIIKGNPGVGKSTVARLIGRIFYNTGILKKGLTVETTKEDLVDRFVGGTPQRTKQKIIEAKDSVLFIDDAYSLIDDSETNNYSKEAIDEIVADMTKSEEYPFSLIMAGYPKEMDKLLKMNVGLKSRFSDANIITIEDYPPDLLKEIFIKNCRKDGYRFWGENPGEENPLDLDLFFNNYYDQRNRADFGNARDVIEVAEEIKKHSADRDEENLCIKQEDFYLYSKYFEKHGVSSIDDIYNEIDNYVGLDFVKDLFGRVKREIDEAEDCKRRGVKQDENPDHFIFAGNPGTGKTTVSKMIGKFYHLLGVMGGTETIVADASELIGSHVGDSAKKVTAKIQEAIDHNAVLCIEEAYQIADSAYSAEIIGSMMNKMTENAKDFKIIFNMYSNRVDDFLKLNSGLSRRLRIVEFPDYNPSQLTEIFDRIIKSKKRTITDEAHNLIKLIMEYKYNTRGEYFGNAGDVNKLVSNMRNILLKRTENSKDSEAKYIYTKEDIPKEEFEHIKNQINPRTIDDIMADLNEQIGLSDLKDIIYKKQNNIVYNQKTGKSVYEMNPGYYFFIGNAGTGKTTSAKLFAECLYELGIVKTNKFYSCTGKDFIAGYVGQTQGKTYELLKNSVNGVLFIDEAYSLSSADNNSGNDFKKEALNEIIAFMDTPEHRQKCCIIFAGYAKDMEGLFESNSGMRSRIEKVNFRNYTPEEMYQIFALFCKKENFSIGEGIKEYYIPIFEKMSRMEYFSNGRTARSIFEKTIDNLKNRVVKTENISEEDALTVQLCDVLKDEECYSIVL